MRQQLIPFSITIADPTADARYPIAKVPSGYGQMQVVEAHAVTDTGYVESDANVIELTLQDGGADGTGTATVGAAIDNLQTGSHGAWVAATPRAFTITEVLLDEGDYLMLKYNETGTVAAKNITVSGWLCPGQR